MNERMRELALKAGASYTTDRGWLNTNQTTVLEHFAELIAKAEREEIAKMFDGHVWAYDYREIAKAIRAREGQK